MPRLAGKGVNASFLSHSECVSAQAIHNLAHRLKAVFFAVLAHHPEPRSEFPFVEIRRISQIDVSASLRLGKAVSLVAGVKYG